MKRNPEFIVFTGPMWGGKTTKLLSALDRYKHQQKRVVAFKPSIDKRYSDIEIQTHSGGSYPAQHVSKGSDIIDYLINHERNADVIAVDEAFMIDGIADVLVSLFKKGSTIIVSSLDMSATPRVFSEMQKIFPWATKIEKCPAVCTICHRDAFYTLRKSDADELAVGGIEMYEPRCWQHHPNVNILDEE